MNNASELNYQLPQRILQLQNRVRDEVGQFFRDRTPEESVLVLDSTGPIATRHYLVLAAIGRERLLRFRQIHAFSGGAFAVFGFLGLTSQGARLAFPELRSAETERLFRGFHHEQSLSVPRVIWRLARKSSAFQSNAPVRAMLDHIFYESYLQQPFTQFPPNVILHLGQRSKPSIVTLSSGALCHESCKPLLEGSLADAIIAAVTVPLVYGQKNRGDRFFDAVYAGGYSQALREACQWGGATLVSTPWKSGRKADIQYINCFPIGNQKVEMLKDFTRLVLNLRNRGWGDDIYAAFES